MTQPPMKRCCICCAVKPIDEFGTYLQKGKRVYRYCCKQCKIIQHRKGEERNPLTPLLAGAKLRAVEKGLPFNLTAADIECPTMCPYLALQLVYRGKAVGGRVGPDTASLDRVVPALGYVKGNVEVISTLANAMKYDATQEQLVTFAFNVLRRHRPDLLREDV